MFMNGDYSSETSSQYGWDTRKSKERSWGATMLQTTYYLLATERMCSSQDSFLSGSSNTITIHNPDSIYERNKRQFIGDNQNLSFRQSHLRPDKFFQRSKQWHNMATSNNFKFYEKILYWIIISYVSLSWVWFILTSFLLFHLILNFQSFWVWLKLC